MPRGRGVFEIWKFSTFPTLEYAWRTPPVSTHKNGWQKFISPLKAPGGIPYISCEETRREEFYERDDVRTCGKRIHENVPHRDLGQDADGNTNKQYGLDGQHRRDALPEPNAIHAPHNAPLQLAFCCNGGSHTCHGYVMNFLNSFRARKSFIFKAPMLIS